MEYQEFPKWVNGIVVDNAEHQKAVLDGTAIIETTLLYQGGSDRKVTGIKREQPAEKKKE